MVLEALGLELADFYHSTMHFGDSVAITSICPSQLLPLWIVTGR